MPSDLWGKPISKTHSSGHASDLDIWLFVGGMHIFVNGFVTQITTSNLFSNIVQLLIKHYLNAQYPCRIRLQNL